MKVIHPHCRLHFTAADVDFILTTLGRNPQDATALRDLLTDESSRDEILDAEPLYRAIIEGTGCVIISQHLYFYVLVRRALLKQGLKDRQLADYLAEMLAEFSRTERTRARLPGDPEPMDYFFEMLAALQRVDPRTAFALQLHIGNLALYLAGLFRERIEHRAKRRGFPALSYYENLGQANFAIASHNRLADRLGLTPVLGAIADRFGGLRLALNDLTDRLVSLGDGDTSVDRLLIQSKPGVN